MDRVLIGVGILPMMILQILGNLLKNFLMRVFFCIIILEDTMKKDVTMRKTNFVKGAFITTFGIIISKILGILYVIPFHAMIGEKGGALYGYAYTIYTFFMSLATAGIPLAISKVVSEYQTLGYYQAKKRVFSLGKKIAFILGLICFFIVFLFAPILAKFVLGDIVGGNSLEDVTFVIRMIGTAILIVPVLSVYRGYFEGHRFMSPPSISQVLEQVVRVGIILVGCYCALSFFHTSLTVTVSIALLGATIGAVFSCLYLIYKKRKNSHRFNDKIRSVNEPIVKDKVILKKIFMYAIPFILIDIFKSLFNYVDMVTLVKGLVHFAHFTPLDAEYIYSILSTWGAKFNMIILSISTGVVVSLIPSLTEGLVRKDMVDVQKKIHQAFSILLYFTIPLSMGISFLAKPIWNLFYGNSIYGANVLSYYIFVGFFIALFTLSVSIVQSLKNYKYLLYSLSVGLILKIILNQNLMIAFYQMKLPAYYGVITASIIGYFAAVIYCCYIIHSKYHVSFEVLVKNIVDILCGSLFMIFVLSIIKLLIPAFSSIRVLNIFIILFYGVIGFFVYLFYGYFSHLNHRVFDKSVLKTLKSLFIRK